jgi:hypothetical protein
VNWKVREKRRTNVLLRAIAAEYYYQAQLCRCCLRSGPANAQSKATDNATRIE